VQLGYEILTTRDHHVLDAAHNLIWHPQVPSKVSILAWRLLRDRLPTKINLLNRGIITDADTSCVLGCGHNESVDHLFLHCHFFVLFGIKCGYGLVFQELIIKILELIFISRII
jgi:hypothetical protein